MSEDNTLVRAARSIIRNDDEPRRRSADSGWSKHLVPIALGVAVTLGGVSLGFWANTNSQLALMNERHELQLEANKKTAQSRSRFWAMHSFTLRQINAMRVKAGQDPVEWPSD